jgi:uncharacterized protein
MRRKHVYSLAVLLLCGLLAGCAVVSGEATEPDPGFVTVEVAGVGLDPRTQSPVVLLQDPTTERVVPIWVGVAEGEAIARSLHGIEMPRPMTHDLLATLVQRLGARVEEVVIHEQREGTYYGMIRLRNSARGRPIELDSRPSDGLALALRTGAPIRVARALLRDSLEDAPPPPPAATT